ncbi:MAG TPA: prolyl oligopeptidase family serine peptidase, partial [Pirellulaceae bacterium]|nr:prolyl oligopeptidase family serine peptidase [Pirellulaceae bacterium]
YERRLHWSPDSTRLVALQVRAGDERKVRIVESTPKDQLQPKLHEFDYLKPGDRLPHPRPRLFKVAEWRAIPISEELFPNPWSLEALRWEDDSKRFTFRYNQRGHQVWRLIAVDAESGRAQAIIDEQSQTFVDYAQKFFLHELRGTNELIWMSERDGWNHLYLYDAKTGQVKNQITRGEWVVRKVERVDQEARQIWFFAGGVRPGQDPYFLHLCRVNFDGSGFVVLTEGNGSHATTFSPDRSTFVDSWSRVDQASVHELRRTADGSLVCELARADASAMTEKGWRAPQPFVAKGRDGQTDIYGIIVRPSNFDPQRKYPVIEHIYAGPQSAYVPKSFRGPGLNEEIAELGAIVVQIDGMGTSHRSKKFHDVCWKNLADAGFPDRIAWLKAAAAAEPAMDLTRVGVFGGSAGGQNALGALLTNGDFYKVAVADCGCHDNRMDKIWWNELWMGWPIGPHYEQQSNATLAKNLTGRLMLVVGELDKNVDPASTMQVASALVKADKDFDLVVVPGAGHGAAETPYGRRRRAEFLWRNLIAPQ